MCVCGGGVAVLRMKDYNDVGGNGDALELMKNSWESLEKQGYSVQSVG